MIRALSLAGVVAFAAAQAMTESEITTDASGRLQVSRRTTTTIADIDVRIAEAVGQAQVAAERAAFAATSNATTTMFQQMQQMQSTLTAQMAAMNGRLDQAEVTAATQASTLTSTLTAASLQATQSMTAAMQSTSEVLTRTQASSITEMDEEISTALTQVTQIGASIATLRSTVVVNTAGIAGKKDNKVHMWTGGCANTGHSNWQEYCLNQVHVNTALPKFRVHTSTRFITVQAGQYSVNYFVAYRACGWQYQLIYFDNTHRVHGHQRQGYHEGGSSWRDSHAFAQWPVAAGKQIWGRSYSGCWTTWHSTNAGGAHSRITVIYQGANA